MGEMSSKRLWQVFLGCAVVAGGACGDSGDDGNPPSGGAGMNQPGAGSGQPGAGSGQPQGGSNSPKAGTGGSSTMQAGRSGAGMSGGSGTTGAGTTGGGGTVAPGGGGAPMCPGPGTALTGECRKNANGVYALKTEIDVWWPQVGDPPVMDPGRGKITIWLMGE